MRFALAAAAISGLVASGVSAHMLEARQSSLPSCAAVCISGASLGGCAATDTSCLCKNQAFVTSVTDCIYAKCTGSDLTTAINIAKEMCQAVGVTLTSTPVPTSTAGSASSAGGSATVTSASKTGTASGSSASATNAASSNSHSFALVGASSALGLIAFSMSLF
ncbi:hypothetical protein F5887DRAFT_932887 [Amanita rubescens]|nr:hypothetical protein F5887DRAFT_932887 [Amanita rubescens]